MKGSEALKKKLWPLGVKIENFFIASRKKVNSKIFFLDGYGKNLTVSCKMAKILTVS